MRHDTADCNRRRSLRRGEIAVFSAFFSVRALSCWFSVFGELFSTGRSTASRRSWRARMNKSLPTRTPYERSVDRMDSTVPIIDHNFVLGCCTNTFSPIFSGRTWRVGRSQYAALFIASASRAAMALGGGARCTAMGSRVLPRLPRKSSKGLVPSARGMLVHAYSALGNDSPVSLHFCRRVFTDLTAASASPLLSGWYGAASSCVMP